MIPILCAFCFLNGWEVPKTREDQNRPREGSTGKLSKGDRSRAQRGKRWATGARFLSYLVFLYNACQPRWSTILTLCIWCFNSDRLQAFMVSLWLRPPMRTMPSGWNLWIPSRNWSSAWFVKQTTRTGRRSDNRNRSSTSSSRSSVPVSHFDLLCNRTLAICSKQKIVCTKVKSVYRNQHWPRQFTTKTSKMIWICYQLSFLELSLHHRTGNYQFLFKRNQHQSAVYCTWTTSNT